MLQTFSSMFQTALHIKQSLSVQHMVHKDVCDGVIRKWKTAVAGFLDNLLLIRALNTAFFSMSPCPWRYLFVSPNVLYPNFLPPYFKCQWHLVLCLRVFSLVGYFQIDSQSFEYPESIELLLNVVTTSVSYVTGHDGEVSSLTEA